jgi:hypothetical protein
MKRSLLLFVMAITLSCCNNDDDNTPTNPIDQLPPATQTGEQTFGCLINGEPFVPHSFGTNAPNAFYQFVDGAYTLSIYGSINGGTNLKSINVGAIEVQEALEEQMYNLNEEESGNYFGEYNIGGGIIFSGSTNMNNPGILTITNFDQDNFIISGTFSFTVIDNEGNEINITNGRFDMHYTN